MCRGACVASLGYDVLHQTLKKKILNGCVCFFRIKAVPSWVSLAVTPEQRVKDLELLVQRLQKDLEKVELLLVFFAEFVHKKWTHT